MGGIRKTRVFGAVKRKKIYFGSKKPQQSCEDVPTPECKKEIQHNVERNNTSNGKDNTSDTTSIPRSERREDTQSGINNEGSLDQDMEIENHELLLPQGEKTEDTNFVMNGRRIVDLQYLIDQLVSISQHSAKFNCQLNHVKVVKEVRNGLSSRLTLHCSMCGSQFQLNTNEDSTFNINHAAVAGTIMIGCGLENFNELASSIGLPTLSCPQYKKCHDDLDKWWKDTAENTMKDAAIEETEMATEKTMSGKPMVPVTADACWSKRSYRTNYSSLSGVGAIIGIHTGKVLHIGVKNKYCVICARAKGKEQEARKHECTINHRGSSTSMEQAAIVEGFRNSEKERNLVYSPLIADGDASTYKNILDARPYSTVTVEKIECTNHLLRNYNGKNINFKKDTSIPLDERKILTIERLNRLRIAVKAAVRYRKAENSPPAEKIQKLQKDIRNSVLHVFGDHEKCDKYYCKDEKKQEPNYIPHIPALFKKLSANTAALAFYAKSLLYNLNNNRAEQFNALVAKYVGGKRINYALKNSYTVRCYAAVVAFNTGTPITALLKNVTGKSPSLNVQHFEEKKKQRNTKKKMWKPKRRIDFIGDKADYGEVCQKPDMTPDEYDTEKMLYLNNLAEQLKEKEVIERQTTEQSECALWLELRRCLLTASNFAKVCKRRANISPAPLVKSILYGYSLDHVPAVQHGKMNERNAIEQLARQEDIIVRKCGLHIDSTFYFLGATPDGLYKDGIIEIKCPKSAFGMDPEEAIKEKKIKCWKMVHGNFIWNKNHDWYYQVQGQLHITNRKKCLFAVWTGPDHRLKIEEIEKDDDFWLTKMEGKLINFYHKCLVPEIVDSRKIRSMPLRDDPY